MSEPSYIRPPGDKNRVADWVVKRLAEFAEVIHADGITVWLAGSGVLEAVANPLEPQMIGMRQATDRGLISQVYLTGQGILEHSLLSNPLHDPMIDQQLGKPCRAMMVAPLEFGETHCHRQGGVVSAVVWRDDTELTGFSLDGLNRLTGLARELVRQWDDPA